MAAELTIGGVGLLGLLTLFQTCNRAYDVFIRSAKNLGKDAHRLGVHLEVERQKLRLWGRYLGISQSQQCRLLRSESFETQRMVIMLLDAIKNILDDIDIIMVRYGVKIIEASQAGASEGESSTDIGLGNLNLDDIRSCEPVKMAKLKRVTTERSIRASTSRIGKLRWAMNDNKKLEKLVLDLRKINEDLWVALPVNKWLALARGLPSVLLPEIENHEMIVEVGGSARGNERTQLLAACSELRDAAMHSASNISNPDFGKELMLEPGCIETSITINTGDPQVPVETQRELAFTTVAGNRRQVVIEWRYVDRSLMFNEKETIRSRIRLLAVLLSSRRSSEFGMLKCIGFYKDSNPAKERYGLLFEVQKAQQEAILPSASSIPRMPDLSSSRPRSLFEYIRFSKKMPLLGDRFRIATSLCNTVLQLHASSWLHKAIRSSNVLFFPNPHQNPSSSPNDVTNLDSSNPFLLGFDYSRPDKPTADSLDLPSNRTFNDYRHPDLWAPTVTNTTSKMPYRKEFDIYSLGVVLLEIGNWRLVRDLQNQHRDPQNPQKWKNHLLECTDALGYRCGAVYRDVVRTCLTGTFVEEVAWSEIMDSDMPAGTQPPVFRGSFLFDVVYKLGNCSA